MKSNKQQMTDAMQRSWRPGGASRIAYEKRMQEKKTAPLVHRADLQKQADAMLQEQQTAENAINSIVMYRAACLLLMAADPQHRKQAERLIAAADELLGAD